MTVSSAPSAPGAKAASTTPASSALRGMLSNFAVDGSCARQNPPRSLIARSPAVPSAPIPDSTMPTDVAPWFSASERKKKSMGRRVGDAITWNLPSCSASWLPAGAT